jgi:predicted nucleotidyltransferase component of viral defense system
VAKLLTPLQHELLQLFFAEGAAGLGYYLTGGTALSGYYLEHRYSEDLDLFNRAGRNRAADVSFFQDLLQSRNATVTVDQSSASYVRFVAARGSDSVKVELGEDRGQIAPLRVFDGIAVDSLEDIAVNKVCCIYSRTEARDFIDLYFILRETRWELEYLLRNAVRKEAAFDDPREHLRFAAQLRQVESVGIPGSVVRPVTLAELRGFLLAEADRLLERYRPGT